MSRTAGIILGSLLLSSCASVVWVKQKENRDGAKAADVEGIPFYVKTEQFKQTTIYAKTWLRVTLTAEMKLQDKKGPQDVRVDDRVQSYTRDLLKAPNPALETIKTAILNADSGSTDDAKGIIAQFVALPSLADDSSVTEVTLKNNVEPEWVVDRSHTYYLNAPLPWFGTGSLSQELNADGTLSKASSSSDTKVAESLSTLIPFKEYLTGRFVKSGTAAAAAPSTSTDTTKAFSMLRKLRPAATLAETELTWTLSLKIEEVGHEYTLTRKPAAAWPALDPIPFSEIKAKTAMFSMKDIGSSAKEEKEEGQKIGISGAVNFPKDWGSTKAQ